MMKRIVSVMAFLFETYRNTDTNVYPSFAFDGTAIYYFVYLVEFGLQEYIHISYEPNEKRITFFRSSLVPRDLWPIEYDGVTDVIKDYIYKCMCDNLRNLT